MENNTARITVYLHDLVEVMMGVIYAFAPGYKPRKANTICSKACERFKALPGANYLHSDPWFCWVDEIENIEAFVHDLLMPIPEFQELNLTNNEYKKGISVNDPERPEFAFCSRFYTIPEDDAFIDLDACIRNIAFALKRKGTGMEVD